MNIAKRVGGWVGVLVCALTLLVASAHAEQAAPEGYDDAVDSGFRAFEASDYETANAQFSRAHALYPNARTLRALGKVAYELGLYQASVAFLEQALSSSERPLTATQRNETDDLLLRVRAHLAPVTLSVQPQVATLLLDGQPVSLPPDGKLMLAIGDHLLELSAPGYRPERQALRVLPSADQHVSVLLTLADPMPSERAPMGRAAKWWLWTSVGVAIVAGAVAGAVIATRDPGVHDPSGGSTGMTISIPN